MKEVRVLLVALALPLIAAAILGIVLLTRDDPNAPFRPIRIDPPLTGELKVNNRVEGIDGPAISLSSSDPILLAPNGSRTCNDYDRDITVHISYDFIGTDAQGRFRTINGLEDVSIEIPPGCSQVRTTDSRVSFPAEVVKGEWQLTIELRATEDDNEQLFGFISEKFTVTE